MRNLFYSSLLLSPPTPGFRFLVEVTRFPSFLGKDLLHIPFPKFAKPNDGCLFIDLGPEFPLFPHIYNGKLPLHASRLKELAAKRRLQNLCAEAAGKIHERDFGEILLSVKHGLYEIMAQQGAESITGAQIAKHGWEAIEERTKRKGVISGVSCGLKALDDHLDGFQDSELSLTAARPSGGKTALSLHSLLAAVRAGFSAAFFSLEMGQTQIGNRLLSSLSGVPVWKIRKGFLGAEEWQKIRAASETLNGLPVRFIFQVRNLKDIISSMTNLAENKGVKIFYIDYVQLIQADGAQNREREISMISGELKNLAVALKVPVVCLSQLNRASERRDDKRPDLADLRDSGSLEQDADVVILIYRKDITKFEGPVEFIVAKGRNCGCGVFTGHFDGETQRFYEIDQEHEKV